MMYYEYLKNEDKPTLLLLHGWGVSSSYMDSLKEFLKKDYSILIVDLPGHGKSKLNKVYTIKDYIDQLFMIVCKENISSLIGIGHSFGGKLLTYYALKYKIDGILVIAPSCIKPRFSLFRSIKIVMYKILKKLHLPIPNFLQGSRDYKKSSGYKRETFLNVCHSYLSKKELRRIRIPYFIMGFLEDNEVKLYQLKKLNRRVNNSKLFVYPGNHFSYFDHYKDIYLILNILKRGDYDLYL